MDPSQDSLNSLVVRAQAGEEASVGELFERFHRIVYRFLAYRVGSKEDAEDLTQIVFMEMVRSLPQYQARTDANFSSWLFRIARHRLIDYYRRQKTTIPLDDINPAEHPNLQTDAIELDVDTRMPLIRQAIRQLPERYQTVIQLTYIENISLNEAAIIMDISPLSLRVLKFRAVRKLRILINVDK